MDSDSVVTLLSSQIRDGARLVRFISLGLCAK
jgi:hypothetical protein